MKKSNGIGPTARSFRRGICLAAFTLAIVSLIPACKSGSGDETEDLPTYPQLGQVGQADIKSTEAPTQVAANPKTADSSTQGPAATQLATAPVATDTAPQSPEAAQPGPEGQQELAAQAPATQDPAVLTDAGNQQNGADPQEQAVIPKIPEDEVYSLEDAKPGYILMAGGEIVNSSYLAYGGVKGMEPIGIFCFRTGSRKLVLGLDSFYTKEDRYGPGAWPKNEDLKPVSVKPSPDSTGSNRFSCGSSTVKILSAGNQNLILDMIRRGTEEKNLFMDYIKPYGSRIGSSGMELDWQAPTLYEGFLVLCSSTRTRETIKDIIKFFDRIGDDRARILENAGDLIDGTEYILTSSSGQSTVQKTPEYGFWALRRLDQAGEQPDDSRFRELKDQSEQKTLSYKYSPLDFMTDKGIPAEVVLAKPNSDGFRGIAVTYLD